MDSRSYKRKVIMSEETYPDRINLDGSDQNFRKGRYYDDVDIEPGIGSVYLTVPKALISSYYNRLRVLGHSNILKPLSYCKVGNNDDNFQIFFEDKLTYQFREYVNANDNLFIGKEEQGKHVFVMAPILQQVILEIISTFDDLHRFGMVHTRMNIANTWIYIDDKGVIHPKLFDLGVNANNEPRNLVANQVEDRRSVGRLIRTIFEIKNRPPSSVVSDLIGKLDRSGVDSFGIVKYRSHPVFYTNGNKQCTIRQLKAVDLWALDLGSLCPNIPLKYRNLESAINSWSNDFEYDEEIMEEKIKDIEKEWPLMWVDLKFLCDVAYNRPT